MRSSIFASSNVVTAAIDAHSAAAGTGARVSEGDIVRSGTNVYGI